MPFIETDTTSPRHIGIGCIVKRVKDNEIQFLLGERKPSTLNNKVCWCMPGGHVETNESFYDAGLREIEEECGLQGFRDSKYIAFFHKVNKSSIAISLLMEMTYINNDEPRLMEPHKFLRWKWFNVDELTRLRSTRERFLPIARSSLDYYFDGTSEHDVEIFRIR